MLQRMLLAEAVRTLSMSACSVAQTYSNGKSRIRGTTV